MLDPYRSGVRWAANKAGQHIKGFILGGVIFSIVAASVSSIVNVPPHPTALDHVSNAGVGALAALGFITLLAFAYAMIVAPYQQRNILRKELTASRREVVDLTSTRINVRFDPPEARQDGVRIPFINLGKATEFVVYASNVTGQGVGDFEPFPVSWDGIGAESRRLQIGEERYLRLCFISATQFGKSRSLKLSFVTSAKGGYRNINPRGAVTVDLEAKDLTTNETERARVKLSFSEERTDWFKFEGAQYETLT